MFLDWLVFGMCSFACICEIYNMLTVKSVTERAVHLIVSIAWGISIYHIINKIL